MSGYKARLVAFLWSLAAVLVLGETLARVRAADRNAGLLGAGVISRSLPPIGEEARLGAIIERSPLPELVYQLRANLSGVTFKSRELNTNSSGFRGRAIRKKSPDTITVLGIGDSVMFGHGVGDDEPYLEVLGQMLRSEYPQVDWQVITTGVPGYNTAMEVGTLAHKGLAFEPDIVVLGLVPNDLALPGYMWADVDPWTLDRSFLLDALRALTPDSRRRRAKARYEGLDPRLAFRQSEAHADELLKRTVAPQYRHLVGYSAFSQALDRLETLQSEHGFEVVVLTTITTSIGDDLVAEVRSRGWPHADVLPAIQAYMGEHLGARFDPEAYGPYERSALVVSPDNAHPSALQHRMAATTLLATLKQSGALERAMEARR